MLDDGTVKFVLGYGLGCGLTTIAFCLIIGI